MADYYVYLENGEIKKGPREKPHTINEVDTSLMTDEDLISYNWYPVLINQPELNEFQFYDGYDIEITGNEVIFNYRISSQPRDFIVRTLHDRINKLREEKLGGGFMFEGYEYDSTFQSIVNIISTAFMTVGLGVPLPENFTWRTKDNIDVPTDRDKLIRLAVAAFEYGYEIYVMSWHHKRMVEEAIDPVSYDYHSGW